MGANCADPGYCLLGHLRWSRLARSLHTLFHGPNAISITKINSTTVTVIIVTRLMVEVFDWHSSLIYSQELRGLYGDVAELRRVRFQRTPKPPATQSAKASILSLGRCI